MSTNHDDALARQVATLVRAELAAERRKRAQRGGHKRRGAALIAAFLVALLPFVAFAANPFNDLTGGVHDGNIGLIYDAGITKGCVPNVSYCPTATVTREEMASFLARTAGLGTNPPVVNAKTAQTAALATNATNAVNATNATQLGGVAAASYVQTTNRALPIAFATVGSNGVKLSGTANVTVTRTARACPQLW